MSAVKCLAGCSGCGESSQGMISPGAAGVAANLLAKQPGLLAEFRELHRKDCESFEFRCERFGDFLALFIKRGPKIVDRDPHWTEAHALATTINIGAGATIELRAGRGPDMRGSSEVRWYRSPETHRAESCFARYPRYPSLIDRISSGGNQIYRGYERCHTVHDCARDADDDEIIFGNKKTLGVPFGLGDSVYRDILAALHVASSPQIAPA